MIKGSRHTKETKRKISKGKKGKSLSKEHKQKISAGLRGRKYTDETREKISQSLKGNRNGHGNKGKTHSRKTRRKISEVLIGRTLSEEHKQKISEAGKGKHRSRETRRNISNARMGTPHPHSGALRSDECKEKLRRARLKQKFSKKDTSIERALQEELSHRGIFYQKHLPVCDVCQPDIVFPESKIAVFADGDYWHSKDFKDGAVWDRDRHQDQVLRENGWIPLRFWGSEIWEDVRGCVSEIIEKMEVF